VDLVPEERRAVPAPREERVALDERGFRLAVAGGGRVEEGELVQRGGREVPPSHPAGGAEARLEELRRQLRPSVARPERGRPRERRHAGGGVIDEEGGRPSGSRSRRGLLRAETLLELPGAL